MPVPCPQAVSRKRLEVRHPESDIPVRRHIPSTRRQVRPHTVDFVFSCTYSRKPESSWRKPPTSTVRSASVIWRTTRRSRGPRFFRQRSRTYLASIFGMNSRHIHSEQKRLLLPDRRPLVRARTSKNTSSFHRSRRGNFARNARVFHEHQPTSAASCDAWQNGAPRP